MHSLAICACLSAQSLSCQVWMEHRYLLTLEDLQERPSWAAALQVRFRRTRCG